MKKIFFLLWIGLLSVTSLRAQFQWGAEAGLNLSYLTTKTSCYARSGAVVGLNGRYGMGDRWRLQSGLLFSVKGANGVEDRSEEKNDPLLDIRLYYLEIPLTVAYEIPVTSYARILPEAGIYVACGVGGKASTRENVGEGYLISDWNPFKEADSMDGYALKAFERMDAGLRFGLTAEVDKFSLSVNYDLGLWGVHGMLNLPDNIHNRTTTFTLGYAF